MSKQKLPGAGFRASAPGSGAQPETMRKQWLNRIRQRYSLRLHMSLIVATTTAAGVGANWLLLWLGLHPLYLRVFLAVFLTYFIFLGLVRLWLSIVENDRHPLDAVPDVLEVASLGDFSSGSEAAPAFLGKGGQFGGAGAQASFEGQVASAAPASSGGGGADLDLPVPDLDAEGLVLLCLFVLLVGSFLIAGGYLVWEAPVILAETLFEFSLASILLKKLKKTEQSDWMGHLMKLTWKPFAAVMLVTLIFCAATVWLRPGAHRLHDLWRDAEPPATGLP